jgi:hypothetical protein
VFDLQSDQTWNYIMGGALPVLNNTGTLKKSGGSGTSAFDGIVNNDGALNVQSGTVNLAGPSFSNDTNGVVQGTGTVDVSHTTFTTAGQISPGNPLGALMITGNLPRSTNGAIDIEIGGTNAGVNYDQLIVTGNATLNGALNISLTNGFQPAVGEAFEIIDYASHTGTFDNISGLKLANGFYLQPTFASTNLILTTLGHPPGPVFSSPQLLPNGDIDIQLTSIAGETFVIQETTNFLSWDSVLTNVNAGAVFDLIITDSIVHPYRFYRWVQP